MATDHPNADILCERHWHFFGQPIWDASNFTTHGVELLARLVLHGDAPKVNGAPVELFEQALSAGYIHELDNVLLCRARSFWAPDLWASMYINLHFESLLCDTVAATLALVNERAASGVTVELSERSPVPDWVIFRERMEALVASGMRFALDDFGCGHSNLRAVMELPFHTLKVDRAITANAVSQKRNTRILRGMVVAAQYSGMEVVCEGIETERHLDMAISIGCDHLQGYYFGRPEPMEICRESQLLVVPGGRLPHPEKR